MEHLGLVRSEFGIEHSGVVNAKRVYWNLTTTPLVEEAVRRGEGLLSADGALVVTTGKHTGRSPNDKYIVKEPSTEKNVDWGKVNKPFDPEDFERLHARLVAYLQGRDLFVQEARAGAAQQRPDPRDHAQRVALAVRAYHVHPPDARRARERRAGVHGAARARTSRRTRRSTRRTARRSSSSTTRRSSS